jgi:general secretion pathway protein D
MRNQSGCALQPKECGRVSGKSKAALQRILLVLGIVLVVASCATSARPARPHPSDRSAHSAPPPKQLQSDQISIDASASKESPAVVSAVEIYDGTGVFINEEAARKRAAPVSADGEIVLNFEGESIQSVIHTILGEVLQETFIIGPGVSGEVTFSTSKPVTREQLLPILEMLLQWNGATLVYNDGRYNVLPVSTALKGNLSPQLGSVPGGKGYEVVGVPLKYISATEMAKILEPYVREGALINADQFRSMVFLAGTPEDLSNYLHTVEIFDVDWLQGMSVGIYPLRTVDVAAIITELQGIFGAEAETPLAGMFRFIPLERLSSVMVITYQLEYLQKAEEWIKILDRGAAGVGKQLYVYRVKNLEAPILAGYLTEIFGGGGGQAASRTQRGGALAPGLEPVQIGSVADFNNSRVGAQDQGNQAGTTGGSVLNAGEEDIRITSVVETNSLLIQASQSQYNSILAAIERIDIEPLQVLIESQVLDVELNEELQFGVNWFLTNNPALIPPGSGNPFARYIDSAAFGGSSAASGGFNFLSTITRPLNNGGKTFVQATIAALDEVTDVRSLAAPSLLVRNNATATITVGTQVPVQSSSISTGTDNVVSNAQYVSTGVTLTVTPRINPGGLVYMQISQDVSRPGARDPDISTSGNPPINNKTVSTEVAVQSGQTVFLGGLISESATRGRSGVPFLSRVPIIGPLFGSRSKSNNRSETLVMITPTVVENSIDLQHLSEEMQEQFSRVPPLHISPLFKDKAPEKDGQ